MKTNQQAEGVKKLLIEIPAHIYYGGGQVSLKYMDPEGEWMETKCYPIDSLEVYESKELKGGGE